ncbi:hypothetical protein D3C80_1907260 [compost metagenome]
MPVHQAGDYQVTGLILRSGRNLQQVGVVPQLLGSDEIDAMLDLVGATLGLVILQNAA